MISPMIVLGIESTCDETACALVRNGKEILSNVVSSQINLHNQYGGVVPELACRRHVEILIPVLEEALTLAQIPLSQVDLVAVANGPGLVGALLIGLNAAKALSLALDKPFIGVNHVEAHLHATWMSHSDKIDFPALGVVLSGGHTSIMTLPKLGEYHVVSQTVDDAIGEAFDKVAKMLQLPYPGGPPIEKLAAIGNPHRYPFRAGQVKGQPLHFSFSGLKTAVLYAIKDQKLTEINPADLAASFQEAAFSDVIKKTCLAAEQFQCAKILFGGGVTNNQHLRKMFAERAPHLSLYWPSLGLSLDNAAMIAGLGYFKYQGKSDPYDLEAFTRKDEGIGKG